MYFSASSRSAMGWSNSATMTIPTPYSRSDSNVLPPVVRRVGVTTAAGSAMLKVRVSVRGPPTAPS